MKPDTNSEIDAELNAAKARYGSNDFELLCLEGSRGDTLDDEQLLKCSDASTRPVRHTVG